MLHNFDLTSFLLVVLFGWKTTINFSSVPARQRLVDLFFARRSVTFLKVSWIHCITVSLAHSLALVATLKLLRTSFFALTFFSVIGPFITSKLVAVTTIKVNLDICHARMLLDLTLKALSFAFVTTWMISFTRFDALNSVVT